MWLICNPAIYGGGRVTLNFIRASAQYEERGNPMSLVRIWLHCVWGTKRREPLLNQNNQSAIINHIKTNAKDKGIYIDRMNGHHDHLHCIISLNSEQNISKVMNLIKGESSHWINKNNF